MVDFRAIITGLLLAQKEVDPVLQRIDPPRRAAIIMALLALTLIGLFLIIFTMVGGHWVRRLARHRPGKRARGQRDASAQDAQLRASLESILPEAKTDDTVQFGKSSPDTKIES
jgi:hypothetical protein